MWIPEDFAFAVVWQWVETALTVFFAYNTNFQQPFLRGKCVYMQEIMGVLSLGDVCGGDCPQQVPLV